MLNRTMFSVRELTPAFSETVAKFQQRVPMLRGCRETQEQ